MSNPGPHLLGRVPSPPDHRDYQLANFLAPDPLDAALKALINTRFVKQTLKDWATLMTARVKALSPKPPPPPTPIPVPVPVPTPPPPSKDVIWTNTETPLDQLDTSHCIGDGFAQWGNTLPIDDHYTQADADAIYYEAKILDKQPGQENGSTVRSGARAMQNRKRLSVYAFAANIDEVIAWLQTKGPVVFGTDWDRPMFTPDDTGYVYPNGDVQGGHCYLAVGYLPSENAILFLNSWGDWALNGYFKMKISDVVSLFSRKGEACASVELAA